jgi:hypothetical protein
MHAVCRYAATIDHQSLELYSLLTLLEAGDFATIGDVKT